MSRWFYVSIALTVLAFGASLYFYQFRYDELPERVPTHWDANFEVNGWTQKQDIWMPVFLVPLGMAGICLLGVVLPWISPRKFTVESFRRTWDYVMMLVTALIGYIHGVMLWGMLAGEDGKSVFMRVFVGGLCLFFALIGNQLGKVRPNFWMGVRTPWTLASEPVWTRTHRVAAWLFVAAGLVGFLVMLATPQGIIWLAPTVVFIVIMAASLIPVFYSLVLYKRLEREGRLGPPADPAREEVKSG